MNSDTFRLPARTPAAGRARGPARSRLRGLAAGAVSLGLLAGPAALACPAHATGPSGTDSSRGTGRAGAFVLRTDLDVELLNRAVGVPLTLTLNDVRAPRSAEKTALTVRLDGVDHGRPVHVLRADVASAKATISGQRAEGRTDLTRARVHLPGLPLLSLIEVGAVSSRATCEAGRRPVAESNLLGSVTVLGKRLTPTVGGVTEVSVPGVGEVRLDLSHRRTTSRTAAASALQLTVSVDPLNLNVAEVQGTVTLAGASCESPAAPARDRPAEAKPQTEGAEPRPRAAEPQGNLAATGGSSTLPYLAGGALLLVAAGAGAFVVTRRRRG